MYNFLTFFIWGVPWDFSEGRNCAGLQKRLKVTVIKYSDYYIYLITNVERMTQSYEINVALS